MPKELPPQYNPKDVEDKWYKLWEKKGFFQARIDKKKKPYTIVIPPPNITGQLHMGHALNNTIQDILIRWQRMSGKAALWLPGTDHAGIATQNVVEKQLKQEGLNRHQIGRAAFINKVLQWRNEYGRTIIKQLKKLGSSCDWSRERFTLDEGLSKAVREAFVRLYKKGYIYRGKYIINWCPGCLTALSDIEVEYVEEKGRLYYLKYPLKGMKDKFIVVATTRPETMLGDTAVAVNPRDKRFKKLIGKIVILPLQNREIPVLADDFVDPKFGTGAVKVTPAHDAADFLVGQRHHLKAPVVIDSQAVMTAEAGSVYQGLTREECRKQVVEDLIKLGLLLKEEDYLHAIGRCYRCHTVVEPHLSLQWFVKMKKLAEPAIKAVKSKKITFFPARWEKFYLSWMKEIKDWCISRQIWWGHQLPVYYCRRCRKKAGDRPEDSKRGIIVSCTKPDKCPVCKSKEIEQDEDVLDTWFSSALWPFSTLGWPKKTKDLGYFYPTSVLVTDRGIIFFWVARMIMLGLDFIKEIPFKHVYIHGTILDELGRKMSKSLGNGIDPLDMINRFGTDALRFSLISLTSEGQDVLLSESKFEMGRNFANKIWNLARFVLRNLKDYRPFTKNLKVKEFNLAGAWIMSRLQRIIAQVEISLQKYRFNEAALSIYNFLWHEFCDWYLEISKIDLAEEGHRRITQEILCQVLEKSLCLLHPFTPFITEEIWQELPHQGETIMLAAWPKVNHKLINPQAEKSMAVLIMIITAVRNLRGEINIAPTEKVDVLIRTTAPGSRRIILENSRILKSLAGIKDLFIKNKIEKPKLCATAVVDKFEIFMPLEGLIDIQKEKERLKKEITRVKTGILQVETRLLNEDFLQKAPRAVVEKTKNSELQLKEKLDKLENSLKALS